MLLVLKLSNSDQNLIDELGFWILGLLTIIQAFLGLQLLDGRLWDFTASSEPISYNISISLCLSLSLSERDRDREICISIGYVS